MRDTHETAVGCDRPTAVHQERHQDVLERVLPVPVSHDDRRPGGHQTHRGLLRVRGRGRRAGLVDGRGHRLRVLVRVQDGVQPADQNVDVQFRVQLRRLRAGDQTGNQRAHPLRHVADVERVHPRLIQVRFNSFFNLFCVGGTYKFRCAPRLKRTSEKK